MYLRLQKKAMQCVIIQNKSFDFTFFLSTQYANDNVLQIVIKFDH